MSGTKSYMAPELYDVKTTLHKSDSFAIGVILFNLLTGLYPFKSVIDESFDKRMENVVAGIDMEDKEKE